MKGFIIEAIGFIPFPGMFGNIMPGAAIMLFSQTRALFLDFPMALGESALAASSAASCTSRSKFSADVERVHAGTT